MDNPNLMPLSANQQLFLKMHKQQKHKVIITRIGLLVLFLFLWEFMTYLEVLDAFIVSSPSRILRTIRQLFHEGVLFHHIGITCYETMIGFTLGTILGTFIAVLLWLSDFLADVLEPYLVVLNSLPKIALGPIFIVWIGAGSMAIITVALTISIIVTILETYNGFNEVDKDKIQLIRVFGGNKLQIFKTVIFPASLPTIINSLKVNVGLSWVGVIVGEFLVSKAGLGYLIVYGGQVFKLDLVMTSVVILSVIAAFMYLLVVKLQHLIQNSKKFIGG